jgi:hypothetical protein
MKTKIYYFGLMLSVISLTACNANETADELNSRLQLLKLTIPAQLWQFQHLQLFLKISHKLMWMV